MKVQELMTRHLVVCGPSDSLSRAAQIMWDRDCGCVPVVDEGGRPTAMITDRDICMAAYTRGGRLSDLTVSKAASHRLVAVRPDDEIATAEQLMRQFQIRRLPVVDDAGTLVGLVSMNDLARHARRGHRGHELSAEGVTKTLAAVCSPPVREGATSNSSS